MVSTGVTDPAVMRLAHPLRVGLTENNYWELLRWQLGSDWNVLEKYLKDTHLTLGEACYQATTKHRLNNLGTLLGILQNSGGNTDQGGAIGLMAAARQQVAGYTWFKLEDPLVELLEQTDLDEDIPLSYLLPPFERCYIELGQSRNLATCLPNVQSGLHRLEGAYVERGFHREHTDSLYLVMTGSPVGHENAADDATMAVLLPLADLEAPLGKSLEAAFQRASVTASQLGLKSMPPELYKPIQDSLLLVAKALLYLGLPDARKKLHPERTDLERSLKGLKSSAKVAKAQRKLARAYDYILVSAPPVASPSAPSANPDGTRTVKPHWRRGHYRLHRHGPELKLRKLLFIRPTLVAAEHASVSTPPTPKKYEVK